ncbi:MAG: transposase [Deltaproteobacteria bacterium]|nr:transposase [Deltaproteobacteria bacterium]
MNTLFMGYDTINKEIKMFRKSYTREFKIRVVQLMGESSKPIRQLAEELGISENYLYNWRKQLRENQDEAFSNQSRLDEKELEIRCLKGRVSELEGEREILKKTAAFFAKEESQ